MTDDDRNRPIYSNQTFKTSSDIISRIGQVGRKPFKWDNGLYIQGNINNNEIPFLLDSGATATLISEETYDQIGGEKSLPLSHRDLRIQGVDGANIKVRGYVNTNITFGNYTAKVTVIVCDMSLPGILGQDFIMENVKQWNIETLELYTKDGSVIHCYSGEETTTVCRVEVNEGVDIPAMSCMFVSVQVPNHKILPEVAFIDDSEIENNDNLKLFSGIIDINKGDALIALMNYTDKTITAEVGKRVGCCYPIIEDKPLSVVERDLCAASFQESFQDPKISGEARLPEHLREMFKNSTENLEDEEKEKFATLLNKYQDVFAKSSDDLGCTNRVKHTINTGTANPIRQPVRRQPYGKRDIERQEIQKMLGKGIIEPSKSPWSSPIVLVSKKDGSTRFCVDYRRLNEVTVKDAYPIPRVDDCFDALSGSKWFNCMDLNSGFWQIEMDEPDKIKTAFSTSQGLYQFRVMPFGLVNSPSTFERLMEDVLRGIQWTESLLYMDDIITPGKTVDECLQRIENVFIRLREANLKLKPSKCLFFQKSVSFLGHIVSENGVETDPEKVKTVRDWPIPRNNKEVRSFLGLASYYRKFVKGFSDIARPLHKLCEKKTPFKWTDDCQNSFETLKQALISAPILAYPKLGSKFILDTDASNSAVGAVLSQVQDNKERVIAYMSKSMNVHERAYCITRKELLAVVTALKHFHSYLYGQSVLLRTDNAAVSWMRTLKLPTGQVARWLQELNTYNLEVIHRGGRSHSNADALSRMPCKACKHQQKLQEEFDSINKPDEVSKETIMIVTRSQANSQTSEMTNNQILLNGWDPVEISTSQLNDISIGKIKLDLQEGRQLPGWNEISAASSKLKTLWRQWDRLEIKGGMLYRKFEKDDGSLLYQLVTPKDRQKEVIRYHHDIASSGHLGVEKTLSRIRQGFYWPGMTDSVKRYCRECDDCTAKRLSRESNKAPLGQYLVGESMERIMMDILGPLPLSNQGNKYILVIADWFTKWTECVAIPDIETKTVAKAFVDTFVSRFGVPLQIYSDQGRCFESKLMQDLCDLMGIDKTHATSLRPQANGLVERFNRTLISMLKSYCQVQQNNWDFYLQQVMMAYRSSPHSSSKISPNRMMLGREITLPMQAVVGRPRSDDFVKDFNDYVIDLEDNLQKCHDIARENIKAASRYQRKYYDCSSKKRSFKPGQLVWLHDPSRKVGISSKLVNKWKGPFVVTKTLDDIICMVKQSSKGRPKAYHIDRLHPYYGTKIPNWIHAEVKNKV